MADQALAMTLLVATAVGLALGGPLLALGALSVAMLVRFRVRRPHRQVPLRPILMVLIVELRSGASVLSALRTVAERFPAHLEIGAAARVAAVAGLGRAVELSDGDTRILLAHLARAQSTGSSAADAARRMLEEDMAREKAARLARARALPVRLMLPVSLLILPGVVLLAYGPSLLSLLDEVVFPLSR